MNTFINKFNSQFSLVVLASFVLGILLNINVASANTLITWTLIPLMISIFSKIEVGQILKSIKNPTKVLFITAVYMIIIPAIFGVLYIITKSDIAIGFLLVALVPCGVLAPTITDLFKGNISLSMILVTTSHLVAPITIPLLIKLFIGADIAVSSEQLFTTLIKFIVVPLIIGQIFRRYFANFRDKQNHYFTFVNILFVVAITFLVSLTARELFKTDLRNSLYIFAYSAIVLSLFFVLGYNLIKSAPQPDKIATGVSKAYLNLVISIVIAQQFFNEKVILVTLITQIVYFSSLPFTKVLVEKLSLHDTTSDQKP